MSELFCNQIKCKELTCDYHPRWQPWDDPCKVKDLREECKGKPLRLGEKR